MVGLFEYNPPALHAALKKAGKLKQIALVGFDENEVTPRRSRMGNVQELLSRIRMSTATSLLRS